MAYSQSIKKGQFPINCKLCETDEKISCKCEDCDLLMCKRCKDKVHSKFKNSEDHKIIDIKDVGMQNEEKRDFRNIKCKQHAGQSCCLFCQTCDSIVCPSCIAKDHKKHDLIEISEAYAKMIKTMKTRQSQCQKEKAKINEQKIRLIQLKTAETSKYNKEDNGILNHGKALKEALDIYIQKIRKELEENHSAVLQAINSNLDTISRTSQLVDDQTSKTDDLITTTDVTKFFDEVGEIQKLTYQSLLPKIHSAYKTTAIFIPGEITQGTVGMLQTNNKLMEAELSIVKEFQTELPAVYYVCPCQDDSLWICYSVSDILQKVKPWGNSLQVLSSYNINKVYGMALTPNNDLLMATYGTCLTQIQNSTGKIQDSIYNTDPFLATCVHVSKDFKVMVGGYDTDTHTETVIVMNKDGEKMKTYEHDTDNLPLFKYSMAITSTGNGNIFVADFDSNNDDFGRLVILSETRDAQYYTGHPVINKEESFQPLQLTTSWKDNVIVIDYGTDTLHILNNLGQLMTFSKTEDIGIPYPYSLEFTKSGQLYIGCSTTEGSKDKSKLYKVNIS